MTLNVTGTRIGQDGSPAVFNDRKLQDCIKSLDSVLINSPPADLVTDIVAELESIYGSSNVTQSPTSAKYVWRWNPDTNTWEKVEITSTTVTVDDGEPTNVRLVIGLEEILP